MSTRLVSKLRHAAVNGPDDPSSNGGRDTLPILIVDDEPIVVEGLTQILTTILPKAICGHAENGQRLVELLRQRLWAVIVLVCDPPGRGGFSLLKLAKQTCPAIPILAVGGYPEADCAICVMKAGAQGCVTSRVTALELAQAIHQLVAGGHYLSPALVEQVTRKLKAGNNRSPLELLSEREMQVLLMILRGENLKQIAFELGRSVKTVSTHRARILRKLNVTTTVELTRCAIAHGLICQPAVSTPVTVRQSP